MIRKNIFKTIGTGVTVIEGTPLGGPEAHAYKIIEKRRMYISALIAAKYKKFLVPKRLGDRIDVTYSPALFQNHHARGSEDAAHAMDTYLFDRQVLGHYFMRPDVPRVIGLNVMGLNAATTDVSRYLNRSRDKRLSNLMRAYELGLFGELANTDFHSVDEAVAAAMEAIEAHEKKLIELSGGMKPRTGAKGREDVEMHAGLIEAISSPHTMKGDAALKLLLKSM